MGLWTKRYSFRKGPSGGLFEFGIQYTGQIILADLLSVSQELLRSMEVALVASGAGAVTEE
jgi:hypothetical protein